MFSGIAERSFWSSELPVERGFKGRHSEDRPKCLHQDRLVQELTGGRQDAEEEARGADTCHQEGASPDEGDVSR